jgi:hypothetical protein
MKATDRTTKLHALAAWQDFRIEQYDTPAAFHATQKINELLDELEPLSDSDYGVINNRRREYVAERA